MFVCTGNTCRSPFAEKLLEKMLKKKYGEEAEDFKISSAGTYAFSGVKPPPNAIQTAREYGVDLSGHRSRSIHLSMLEGSDIVLCMTSHHKTQLVAKFPWFEDRIFVLREYAGMEPSEDPETGQVNYNIIDPIGQGREVYHKVFGQIKDAIEKIIEKWETDREFKTNVLQTYRVAIGADHAGFPLKQNLIQYLQELGHEVEDFGVETDEHSVDYPDYARPVAEAVARGEFDFGVLVCGSGVGTDIVANRVKNARSVLARDVFTAKMSRSHNNTNILSLGARFTAATLAREILRVWLSTPFEGGRHERRVRKIDQ